MKIPSSSGGYYFDTSTGMIHFEDGLPCRGIDLEYLFRCYGMMLGWRVNGRVPNSEGHIRHRRSMYSQWQARKNPYISNRAADCGALWLRVCDKASGGENV